MTISDAALVALRRIEHFDTVQPVTHDILAET
jgi:hypothetical protein